MYITKIAIKIIAIYTVISAILKEKTDEKAVYAELIVGYKEREYNISTCSGKLKLIIYII